MQDSMTITGVVATDPQALTTSKGVDVVSFRLASNQRKFNRVKQEWENGDTNWFSVSAFRQLAQNCGESVHKGDRVVVTGRLRVRDWEAEGRSGTSVGIIADAIGHDLSWGTSVLTRRSRAANQATHDDASHSTQQGDGGASGFDPDESGAATDSDGWALPGSETGERISADGDLNGNGEHQVLRPAALSH